MTRSAAQHFAEAERLLHAVRAPIFTGAGTTGFSDRHAAVALAQLHATMAVYLVLAPASRDGGAG